MSLLMEYSVSTLLKEVQYILSEIQKNIKKTNPKDTVVDPALDEINKIDMNSLKIMMDYKSRLDENIPEMDSVPGKEELKERSK
jgi:hypothetical protein